MAPTILDGDRLFIDRACYGFRIPYAEWVVRRRVPDRGDVVELFSPDVRIAKFFLHISKAEQKKRFEERLADPRKRWKFDPADLAKRAKWDQYRKAFEDAINRCTTEHAPWYVVPADRKWFRDFAVSQILLYELEQLPLRFPKPAYDPASVGIR